MFYHSFSIGYVEIPSLNSTLNIYTVGCPFHCVGCQNPELQDINHKERKELDIKEIVRAINESFGIIQGICWLGGEPFFQFDECIKISKRLKQLLPNIPVTAYTGYTIENLLEKNSDIPKYFELIIDGQWNGHPISDPLTNQRFWKSQNNKFIQLTYEQYKNIKF